MLLENNYFNESIVVLNNNLNLLTELMKDTFDEKLNSRGKQNKGKIAKVR